MATRPTGGHPTHRWRPGGDFLEITATGATAPTAPTGNHLLDIRDTAATGATGVLGVQPQPFTCPHLQSMSADSGPSDAAAKRKPSGKPDIQDDPTV